MRGRNAHERDGAHNRHEPAKGRPAAESCKSVKHLDLPIGVVFSRFCLRGAPLRVKKTAVTEERSAVAGYTITSITLVLLED